MKKIGLLGSTGSIGVQTLNIVRGMPDKFTISYICANNNVDLLVKQAKEFKPKAICINNQLHYKQAIQQLDNYNIKILSGEEGLEELSKYNNIDLAINAIVGIDGMLPTYNIVSSGIDLALANKESLVMAGKLISEKAIQTGSKIFPVDSEHSAIWQCLIGEDKGDINKIILTGSGGPFRKLPLSEFNKISVESALKHPNWSMGKKISIDSATMMNKGLEVIEACWLFDISYNEVEIIIHPQSIIHSMVEFVDGSVKAQLGLPDMTIPIQYAMTYPNHMLNNINRIDFSKISELTFEQPDLHKFPCIKLAYEAQRLGGSYPTVLNIANDIAVNAFLNSKINFLEIYTLIEKSLDSHQSVTNIDLSIINELKKWTTNFMKEQIQCLH